MMCVFSTANVGLVGSVGEGGPDGKSDTLPLNLTGPATQLLKVHDLTGTSGSCCPHFIVEETESLSNLLKVI